MRNKPKTRKRSKLEREVHQVVKRAQGGTDFDLDRLVALCPPCHAQTDTPYARGRLVITPVGNGRFTTEVIQGIDKWAIRVDRPWSFKEREVGAELGPVVGARRTLGGCL